MKRRPGEGGAVGAAPSPRQVDRLRWLARLSDAWFRVPGTRWRIGLDPLVGLVPGIGDALGAVVSAAVLVQAARWGAPGPVLLRMLANIAMDAIAGSIPVLGDVFDATWKANLRNVDLLERYLADPVGVHRGSARVVIALVMAVILLVVGTLALSLLVLWAGLHILAR